MTAQPIERTDLGLFEALDFDPPCESLDHGEPDLSHVHRGAAYALVAYALTCGCTGEYWYCQKFTHYLSAPRAMIRCRDCGAGAMSTRVRIVGLVRP